jgi:P-aminobenzoate N-oxygenase AurF
MDSVASESIDASPRTSRMAGADDKKTNEIIQQLTAKSLRDQMDYNHSVPWELGCDKTRPAKKFDQVWLYNTSVWSGLTHEQQIELTWLEAARDISMFINLEQLIPQLFSTYLVNHGARMSPEIHEYMMVFSREELLHIMMFNRYLKIAALEKHEKNDFFYKLVEKLLASEPEVGITFTLLIEWLAECKVMLSTQSDEIDPLTRAMTRAHHIEEVRHLHFGKTIAEAWFARTPPEATAEIRAKLRDMILSIVHAVPAIQSYASFTLPCDLNDPALIEEARSKAHYHEIVQARYGEVFAWARTIGVDL